MILQALVQEYEDLAALGKIAEPGWSLSRISYCLCLNMEGQLTQVISMKTEQQSGKKTALLPQNLKLPAPVKRTAGVCSNFLWDNATYLLGLDGKGKPERAKECFLACKTLHEKLLAEADTPAAKALLNFFNIWNPASATDHPILTGYMDDLLAGANLIFRVENTFLHTDPIICAIWQRYYDQVDPEISGICMVTGQQTAPEQVHPSIKGVQGAQSSGAALISFNAPAFCSYSKEQNLNAPVGKYAAFAYTSALNHLLSDRRHISRIGDTTVIYWAVGGNSAYADAFSAFTWGSDTQYDEKDLRKIFLDLTQGKPVDFEHSRLDPETSFYILGLAPNAARLSVRFFLQNSFGVFLRNVQAHYDRMEIVKPSYEKFTTIPPWKLLSETVNQNSRDKTPTPGMAGEVMRAILMNTSYPATLLNGVQLRIRAEQKITWGRASILKAYYTKCPHPDVPLEEVLTVSLNETSNNIPYILGRLFSVLEHIQTTANPGINSTIKDRYFNAASATPSRVFPTLINLAQKHLRKIGRRERDTFNEQLAQILLPLNEEFPNHLNLPQQGAFQLGYYHQTQKRYGQKEEH